jgi:hypothetical protein
MPSQQEQPYFAVLSYVLLAMIGIFLVSNLAFITGCVSASRTTGVDSCKVSDTVESLAAVIPAINRPVFFLEQQGSHQRAELVASVYSFAWASALATAAAMIVTAWATAALLSDDSKRAFKESFERMSRHWTPVQRDQARKSSAVIALIAIWPFWETFWGNFDFSNSGPSSHLNMVHVSDKDLYRLSILLAALLLFFMLPLILSVGNIVLKSATGQARSRPPAL